MHCVPLFECERWDSFTLNVKTKNLNNKINTREIAIIYQVYYSLMKTHLAPKARNESIKGETMLMEANYEHSSIFVPRLLQWKDILSNNDWHFENITQPFASHYERSQIERVIQFPDGSIELKLLDNPARRSSSNRRSSWSPSTSCPSRSVPRPPSSSKTPEDEEETISVTDNSKDIPGSPTASEMEPLKDKPACLGMLKIGKTFEPNPNILHGQWIHPDNQYEENAFLSTSAHERRSITEWNIDGLVEHQVYNKLHEMGVAITVYKMRGSADRDAANMIIEVVKMEGSTQSTSNVTREDVCATLLYHITKHFIREPKLFQDRSLQILSNLSCPNLDNFIHYKHAFLSKVMIRSNCNLDFWKERFISGLPPLFADKVRTKIQYRKNGSIPYSNLTYGDLVSTINVVELDLCTDIKLKHRLKKE
ncbi:hypothetical protein KY290_010577 [Solanum tuberosum]|uniref:DUF7746 domain-containing protein n=1 Tax=Solanum tuberosum TaxID=4113 RepID=A0ABQ7VY77_SOLTU|nr:hypothetical protein KY290_010577 [Solanum tuberosum]